MDEMMGVSGDLERIRAYLIGRLSDADRLAFEDRLVRDPELVREFERSLRLQEGLEQLRAKHYVARGTRPWASARRWLPALAAAAGLAAAVLLLRAQLTPGPQSVLKASAGTSGRVFPATALFTFVSTRAGSTPELALPVSGLLEFRAAPAERRATARYRVTLLREETGTAARTIGEARDLALGTDGYVHAYADASQLSLGNYLLRLETNGASEDSAEIFPFKFGAPAKP